MKARKVAMASRALTLGSALVLGVLGSFSTVQLAQASKASANDQASKAYAAKYHDYYLRYGDVLEFFDPYDLTGDGVREGIYIMYRGDLGSGRHFLIYSYKNGKMECLFNGGEYGYWKFVSYPKTKSFIAYQSGHGGEAQTTYAFKRGKFCPVAERARSARGNARWIYYKYKSNAKTADATNLAATSRAKYKKSVRKFQKGKKQVISIM